MHHIIHRGRVAACYSSIHAHNLGRSDLVLELDLYPQLFIRISSYFDAQLAHPVLADSLQHRLILSASAERTVHNEHNVAIAFHKGTKQRMHTRILGYDMNIVLIFVKHDCPREGSLTR